MPIEIANRGTRHARRFRLLVAGAAGLYLLVNAFLILCLIHPADGHSHGPSNEEFETACVWVQKAVSSHALSVPVFLPPVEAILFVLSSFPLLVLLIRAVQLTGQSSSRATSWTASIAPAGVWRRGRSCSWR
jgi:hypothetical protein